MNETQCEGLSISVDQLNDELDDHWTQTEEKKKKKESILDSNFVVFWICITSKY